jgi:peptide/nickel transport system permease protein
MTVINPDSFPEPIAGHDGPPAPGRRQRLSGSPALRVVRRPSTALPLLFLVAVIVACLAAPLIAPYGPLTQDLANILQRPSSRHLLGTDTLGRDVLSRLLYGGRISFEGVAEAVGVALALGVPAGLVAGYLKGRVDTVVSRLIEVAMAIPGIIVLLMALSVFGNSIAPAMIALGVLSAPALARVVRSATLEVSGELYISAARVIGLRPRQIMARHILPRITGPIVVNASILCGSALLVQAGLAFLGFGVQPPAPSWGSMVQEASTVLAEDSWLIWPSGALIALTVLSFILLGDAIRDSAQATRGSAAVRPTRRNRRTRRSRGEAAAEDGAPGRLTAALLEVRNLSVLTSSGTKVVDDVTFSVERGEAVALVGESGCGKTFTALSVLGMPPGAGVIDSGSVRFQGRELTSLSSREWLALRGSGISYIAQEPIVSLDPTFTVGSQLREVIRLHDRSVKGRAAVRRCSLELLSRCGITRPEEVAELYPHQISGGMAQRVSIARALAGNPALLIADEPTTALDVTIQAEILDLIFDLQAESQMAVLFVTHDWGVVADICTKAVVMYAGQVVETAAVEDLLKSPRHPYAAALLGANPHLVKPEERLHAIEGSVPSPGSWPIGCRFAPRCPLAAFECTQSPIDMYQTQPGHGARCIRIQEASAHP